MLQRFTLLCISGGLILATGCNKPTPEPKAPAAPTTATPAPAQPPAAPPAKPDDPAAVAELEKAKVILTRNAAGNVERADCKEAALSDAQLELFKGLPSLTYLSLENSEVTNSGLGTLAGIVPQLKTLGLRKCTAVSDEGLGQLKTLTNLEQLLLLYSRITDAGMPYVADLKGLRALDLRGCTQITDAGLAEVGKISTLVDLKLRNFELTDAGVKHLANLKLRTLEIEDANSVTSDGMVHLAGMTDLTKLNLMRTHIDDKGLESLAGMKKLRDLRLRGTSIDGSGLKHVLGSKDTLVYLDISETPFGSEGMPTIAEFKNLETLEMWAALIRDDDVPNLLGLTKLRDLSLEQCSRLTSAGLAKLAALPSLESLNIKQTRIDDDGLIELSKAPKLMSIDVSNTEISDSAIDKFKEARPKSTVTY